MSAGDFCTKDFVVKIFSYVLTISGSLIGGYYLFCALFLADSGPQQAAGAAVALAFVVLPYCFARAIEKLSDDKIGDDIAAIANYYRAIEQKETQERIAQLRQNQAVSNTQPFPKWYTDAAKGRGG